MRWLYLAHAINNQSPPLRPSLRYIAGERCPSRILTAIMGQDARNQQHMSDQLDDAENQVCPA
jgi:hypothetical protein